MIKYFEMPFVCKFQLNNGAIDPIDKIFFLRFIDASFGKYHSGPVAIAEVDFNGKRSHIFSNSPCFPSTKGNLNQGDEINSDTVIGYFSADGEDIPYSKPYAIISD